MYKKYLLQLSFLFLASALSAQTLALKKGIVLDSVPLNDSIPGSFSLFLPTNFTTDKTWPVVFVFDLEGTAKQSVSILANAAEKEGYVVAASRNLLDSLPLSDNMLRAARLMSGIKQLLPMDEDRVYTAGFSSGAKLASLFPLFIQGVSGVISCGASLPNFELLNPKNPFHQITIVGREDFAYTDALRDEKILNNLKFPNHLLIFEGGKQWPDNQYLQRALRLFKLCNMAKGNLTKDSVFIEQAFNEDMVQLQKMLADKKLILAEHFMLESLSIYRLHQNIDSLRQEHRRLKKEKEYRLAKRQEKAAFFQESLLREDYRYYLEEDILTYNFNNLGWWNYQMGTLVKLVNDENEFKQRMGKRMQTYVNALVDDSIDLIESEKTIDEDAQILLYMLKTITAPNEYDNYLKVISISSKHEDFGTAIFYLEELLKKGFKDKERLYDVEHTALFRISPEFNDMVSKYLSDSRYDVIEE